MSLTTLYAEEKRQEVNTWVTQQPWYRSKTVDTKEYQITEEGKKEYFKLTGQEWKSDLKM